MTPSLERYAKLGATRRGIISFGDGVTVFLPLDFICSVCPDVTKDIGENIKT